MAKLGIHRRLIGMSFSLPFAQHRNCFSGFVCDPFSLPTRQRSPFAPAEPEHLVQYRRAIQG
jgi:hypothetical protein